MNRSYYSEKFADFITEDSNSVLSKLNQNHQFDQSQQQKYAWKKQIQILKENLKEIDFDRILFEYTIPRMGKRADNVLFYKGVVYVLEFKVDSMEYPSAALKQVEGYGLDLKDFQAGSRDLVIVPILVSTEAPDVENVVEIYHDRLIKPLKANATNLKDVILQASVKFNESPIDAIAWEKSLYKPTPTIIEAAQALYAKHSVEEITKSDSEGTTFTATTAAIDNIITDSKKNKKKSIIFVTGIPGSGKTLIGLNVAATSQDYEKDEHAVYLSGNDPLIAVIREALARDRVANSEGNITKMKAKSDASVFFQHLRHFRKEAMDSNDKPTEKIVIFDEAQRMWSKQRVAKEVKKKQFIENFNKSEPDVLLEYMNRHPDWSVVICLTGGGQEINKGEDGVIEWIKSLQENFSHWHVYMPKEMYGKRYVGTSSIEQMLEKTQHVLVDELHLNTSVRSFRSPYVSQFIDSLLDRDTRQAIKYFEEFKDKYKIYVTRDLQTAKNWVKSKARGVERYGIFATTKSYRLVPEGIVVRKALDFNAEAWYLDSDEYVDTSNFLEVSASEFDSQGLEVDWSIVAWDAYLRPHGDTWEFLNFRRKEWVAITKEDDRKFRINALRIILTRARQGMVIFVPKGSVDDPTRKPEYYNGIYEYLKEIGLEDVPKFDSCGYKIESLH